MEQTIEPLRSAVKTLNVAEFRFCAHALKSSGNNMGATSLAHLCGQLEKVSDLDFTKHRLTYLSQLEHEIEQAITALKDDIYSSNIIEMAGIE
jgi:HPt (histidine-containing phosphotransfer) domain-containing protein